MHRAYGRTILQFDEAKKKRKKRGKNSLKLIQIYSQIMLVELYILREEENKSYTLTLSLTNLNDRTENINRKIIGKCNRGKCGSKITNQINEGQKYKEKNNNLENLVNLSQMPMMKLQTKTCIRKLWRRK